MNRRQKIIVSITGIFLVLLILVGLTYAYFLTRIQGNSNEKSISATTADLKLVYGDGNGLLTSENKLVPNTTVGTKTFTVKNEGDTTVEDYVVVFEDVLNTLDRPEDLVYTVTCSSSISKTCNGVDEETRFPVGQGVKGLVNGIIVTNSIDSEEEHTYKLTLTYKEPNVDQSSDMNKTIEGKINIKDGNEINPYNSGTLAYNIINNAATTSTGTKLTMTPETKPLEEISTETEKELSITSDDYGTSYYYRGNVEDNYVQFAGMCWRIVRIQGDGSVKLILASEGECNSTNVTTSSGYAKNTSSSVIKTCYGYKMVGSTYTNDYINSEGYTTEGARVKLNEWLGRKITGDNLNKLKKEKWCIGDLTNAYSTSNNGKKVGNVDDLISKGGTSFEYTAGNRFYYLKTPKIKCETTGTDGEIDENKIGMLTMDEVAFAGGGESGNSSYYLNKNASTTWWLTLSPSSFHYGPSGVSDQTFRVGVSGDLSSAGYVYDKSHGLRPAITLVPGIEISEGNGTLENPYKIAD